MGQPRWWKSGCLAVLAVVLLGTMSACGGGGGDDDKNADYDFNGTWVISSVVVQSNLPGFPVGTRGDDVARVTQSGTAIVVIIEGVPNQNGTCDPVAGTFSVSGTNGVLVVSTNGSKVDEDTMTGQWTMTAGPYVARATCTINLTSRSRGAGTSAGGGLLGAVRDSLE